MNMLFLVNGITIALCMAVIFYCYILSKNLKAMRDLKNGIGAAITNMTQTTEDMSRSFEKSKSVIQSDNEKLRDTIDEGVALTDYLSDLVKKANNQINILEGHLQQSHLYTKPAPAKIENRYVPQIEQQEEDEEDEEYLDETPRFQQTNRQPLREFNEYKDHRTSYSPQQDRRIETNRAVSDSLQRILNDQHTQQSSQQAILRSKMPKRWEQYEGYAQNDLDDVIPKGFEDRLRRQRA